MPFFPISLAFKKPKISAIFFQIGWGVFRISLRYCLSQFSHVIVSISFIAKKSKREISLFFSAFRHFHQNRKMSTFFRSLCSASFTDSCQKMARIEMLAEHFCAIVEATFEFGALFHYGVL